ncbi:MAG: phosphatase PAP2 family protein [Ilumatobacteraceae bacterium]
MIALLVAIVVGCAVFAIVASRRDPETDVETLAHTVGEHADASPWLSRFLHARRDPSSETGLLLTAAVIAVATAIVLIGVLLEMVNDSSGFARWDDSAARFGARHASRGSTRLLELITDLGSWWFVTIAIVIVGGVQYLRHRRRSIPLYLVLAVLSTGAVNTIVKLIVNRDRPDIARLVNANGSSFPSGHSATAAATFAAIAFVLCRYQRRNARIAIGAAAAALTIAVATSRVLLGVHWLTDVVAGVLVGWSCCALCTIAFGGRIMRFGEPIENARAAVGTTTDEMTRTTR